MVEARSETFTDGMLLYETDMRNVNAHYVKVSAIKDSILLGYHPADSVLHIPGKIVYDGTEYVVRAVKKNGFSGCSFIRELIIDEGVKVIEDNAFEICSNMECAMLPSSVDSVGVSLFAACERLKQIRVDRNNPCFDSRQDCNAIIDSKWNVLCAACPATVIPSGVSGIRERAFSACFGIRELKIPEGIKFIGSMAFSYCGDLQSVHIPSSVEQIGQDIFYDCRHLRCISVNEGNETYDSRDNCNAIIEDRTLLLVGCSHSVIPQGVEAIANGAFQSCHEMESIIIPEGVKTIGNRAFYNCIGLRSIVLPHSLKNIGGGAFSGCTSLDSVSIPENVKDIGISIFNGCASLKSIVVDEHNGNYDSRQCCNGVVETYSNTLIATCRNTVIVDGVRSIADHAFSSIPLEDITIPSSVEQIHPEAFTGLESCLTISVDPNNPVFDSRQHCNAIIETATNTLRVGCQNTEIPCGIEKIGAYAFYGGVCHWNIQIPDGITTIGEGAFSHCDGLELISFPRSLREIEDFAFSTCSRLRTVIFKGDANAIKLGWRVFRGSPCSEDDYIRKWIKEKGVHESWE